MFADTAAPSWAARMAPDRQQAKSRARSADQLRTLRRAAVSIERHAEAMQPGDEVRVYSVVVKPPAQAGEPPHVHVYGPGL